MSKWDEYFKHRTSTLRNEIVKDYLKFVHYLVGRIIHQLPQGMQKEDLVQFGVCGLIEAVERYDPNQGAKFETFAAMRIHGAMLDEIRRYGKSGGGPTRSAMTKLKSIEEATKTLEKRLRRHPTSLEIAKELKMDEREYEKTLSEISCGVQISIDELVGEENSRVQYIKNDDSTIPEEECILEERKVLLGKAIDELPEKEKIVIMLYYHEELTLKEIGEYLQLSESRISQLHTQAIIRLRSRLQVGGD